MTNENNIKKVENLDETAELLESHLSEVGVNVDIDIDKTGRSFPDALDGTSDSYVSKTAAEENTKALLDRPMHLKLKSVSIEELVKTCSDAIADITQYEQERTEVNAEISAIREKLEAKGISKKALGMAIQVSKMSEDQMDGFDLAYTILRKSIARPIQDGLFDTD